MENTPLELYETAYRLHYVENRMREAVEYYNALIKEFPESTESGYAVIQLQKIKSNDISHALKKRNRSPVAIFALLLSIFSTLSCFCLSYYLYAHERIQTFKNTLIIRAVAKINFGETEAALELLTQAKNLDYRDFSPFEVAAGLHIKNSDYLQARMEYEHFDLLNPGEIPREKILELKRLEEKQATNAVPAHFIQPLPEIPINKVEKTFVRKKKAITPEKKVSPKTDEKLYLINPDSISYF